MGSIWSRNLMIECVELNFLNNYQLTNLIKKTYVVSALKCQTRLNQDPKWKWFAFPKLKKHWNALSASKCRIHLQFTSAPTATLSARPAKLDSPSAQLVASLSATCGTWLPKNWSKRSPPDARLPSTAALPGGRLLWFHRGRNVLIVCS